MSENQKLDSIQYLRAIAVVAVVVDHAAAMAALPKYFGVELLGGYLYNGFVGVDIFFVISGFIMTLVALDSDLRPKVTLSEFFLKRFVRIVPLMWLSIISYAVLRYVAVGYVPIEKYLTAAFLVPFGAVDPNHLWTLRHEMIFYSVFAFSVLLVRSGWMVLFAWVLSPILYLLGIGKAAPDGSVWAIVFSPVNIQFAFGVLVGVLYVRRMLPTVKLPDVPVHYVCLLAVVGIMGVSHMSGLSDFSIKSKFVLGLLSFLLVIFALCVRGSGSRLFYAVGEASYSVYLFHLHFASASLILMKKFAPGLSVSLVVSAVVLISIFVGYLAYMFVERPVVRYVGSRFRADSSVRAIACAGRGEA